MRIIPTSIRAMLAIVVATATMLAAVALALAGYLPFGGDDRGGYEHTTLAGHVKFGGYDRGGYEYSAALFGHEKFGGYDRGGYEYSNP